MKVSPRTIPLADGRSVELRSPEPRDAEASLTFLRQLSRESSRNLNHPPSFVDGITVEAQATFLESTLSHARNFMISAWLGDVVAGSTNLVLEGAAFSSHVGQLGIGVLKAHQRIGLGRVLTEALIRTAEENDISNLILRVRTFNEPAIRLYESVGFRRVGTLVGIARLPEGAADEHIYQRIAAPPRLERK